MKKITTVALSILAASAFVSGTFAANTDTTTQPAKIDTAKIATAPQSDTSDASYTIGYSIGKNMTEQLKQQNVALNTDDLQQGFVAGIDGSKPKLTQEQMEQSMQSFQKEMEAKMKAHEEAAQAEAVKAKGDAAAKEATTTENTQVSAADSAAKDVDATSTAAAK